MTNVALWLRTSYWDYEDLCYQEALYIDRTLVWRGYELSVDEVVQLCLDCEVQVIGMFDEEKEQASLDLLDPFTTNVCVIGGMTSLDTPPEYEEEMWDYLTTYANYEDGEAYLYGW